MGTDEEKKPEAGPGPEPKPLISYPTDYAFKVIGKQEHGFREYIRLLFKRLMGTDVSPDSIAELPSRQGRYISLTVTVVLLSEEQRQTIYGQLFKEKRILYYL
jgi:putative lipoic acid-binding regulatory protein